MRKKTTIGVFIEKDPNNERIVRRLVDSFFSDMPFNSNNSLSRRGYIAIKDFRETAFFNSKVHKVCMITGEEVFSINEAKVSLLGFDGELFDASNSENLAFTSTFRNDNFILSGIALKHLYRYYRQNY